MMPEIAPLRIESAPSSGVTVRSSTTVIFTGSAPERSEIASALALATLKLPEICALPPRIGSLIDGADSTLPSSRSEERRVGKECVRTCRSRWSPAHLKKNKQKNKHRYFQTQTI